MTGDRSVTDQAFNRWCYGLRRLEEAKSPILILVYGEEVEVQGLHTPLKFVHIHVRFLAMPKLMQAWFKSLRVQEFKSSRAYKLDYWTILQLDN